MPTKTETLLLNTKKDYEIYKRLPEKVRENVEIIEDLG